MQNYRKLNLIFGWLIFAVASTVYLLTIEPTSSFWDCGEFIACSFKLLVGHPPGAPLFLTLGRLFTIFNPSHAALMVNIMSALASGFTILFLFWSLTHLMAKLYRQKDGSHSAYDMVIIFGAAAVGSLAYTFSDTFWFSAVEGEVYALSSLFTAVVFWAILKWESEAEQTFANRWIVLIAYLMGLSIGVHLLNLLAIPAMVMVYYFKKYKVSTKGILYAAAASVIILAVSLYGIIPWTWIVGSWFELAFVNGMGLPYNSGLLFYVCLLFAALGYAIWYTHRKGKQLMNIIALCVTVMLLGYGSYAMVLIRSSANTSMDQNDPENVFNLMSYLNRDQYGDRPLFKGQYFNAPAPAGEDGAAVYAALNGRYEVVDHKTKYIYDERFTTMFPRMFSQDASHVSFYKTWNGGFKGKPVRTKNERGENEVVYVPTFAENVSFFLTYQVGYMYLRYFMWNFAGRQNDQQGHGEITRGNWISGIPFIDNARLGDQSLLPDSMKENKGRNRYYMLPLILGLAGMFFQYKRSKKDFTVVTLLFFFTGIAIVMYLNQSPIQPRERDYAYAGSFYAFAFWIGIGVAAVAEALRKIISKPVIAGSVATVASMALVPCVMAKENWDDHNRSGRYLARDFAYNYLNSCKDEAVLFTYGDNDTFPLWYAQEVEGIRTDVRIMNLSYSSADWYIEQMQQGYYKSKPLPMSLKPDKVAGSRRAIVLMQDRIKEPLDIKKAMDFVVSDEPSTKARSNYRGMEAINYFPSRTLRLETNVENALRAGIIENKQAATAGGKMDARQERGVVTVEPDVLPYIDISLGGNYVYRNTLAIIDLLANFSWERPIYWGTTVPSQYNIGLEKYFKGTGFANLFVPQQLTPGGRSGGNDGFGSYTNADSTYDKIMNVYNFRNINDSKVYYDENCMRMIASYRNVFTRCIFALINEGKNDKAKELLNKYIEVFPAPQISYYYSASSIVDALHFVGEHERANEISGIISHDAEQQLRYFKNLKRGDTEQDYGYAMRELMQLSQSAKRNSQADEEKRLNDIVSMYR